LIYNQTKGEQRLGYNVSSPCEASSIRTRKYKKRKKEKNQQSKTYKVVEFETVVNLLVDLAHSGTVLLLDVETCGDQDWVVLCRGT
jgi:hypothetical protein